MTAIIYDHYVAIDWAQSNMAIARMTKGSNKLTVIDVPADVGELRTYLENLRGRKIVTIEETTTSHWLYTELAEVVDKVLICDPHRNKLLSEGAKTDKIDASKLVQLLKADLLKEVYHSADQFIHLRRLASGYEDLVHAGVRLQNQRYSLLRACGKTGQEAMGTVLEFPEEQFTLTALERQIAGYEAEKKEYEKRFKRLAAEHPEIRCQTSLPGIGYIGAVKIVSRVVSPHRFADRGHYLSYAGLIKLERRSGMQLYGRKNSRYSRQLKTVYKTGAMAAIGGNNEINDYYEYLLREKGYAEHNARHKACRRLATLSLGVFKSGRKYQPKRRESTRQLNQA